jgi:hypothetical protein
MDQTFGNKIIVGTRTTAAYRICNNGGTSNDIRVLRTGQEENEPAPCSPTLLTFHISPPATRTEI